MREPGISSWVLTFKRLSNDAISENKSFAVEFNDYPEDERLFEVLRDMKVEMDKFNVKV